MRPLAFQFKETPTKENLDYSLIEYDEKLNLSVNRKTRQPAINSLTMDTETVTRAHREGSDSDNNNISMLMDTTTFTKSDGEVSDSDYNSMSMLLDTETRTYTHGEESDSDMDRKCIQALMDTSTLTESREDVDQDK